MRKRQPWMQVGRTVLADGKPGTIIRMETNTLGGTEYVYYIYVRIIGEKHAKPYHPNDVHWERISTGEEAKP